MLKQTDDFGPRRFHAGKIAPNNRFAVWRDVVNTWLLPVDIRPVADRPFQGSACLRVLPELRFGWGALDATFNKRSRQIASRDNDDLFLFITTGERLAVTQGGHEVNVPARGGYLMSCAEPGAYNWPEGMKLLALRTPIEPVSALVRNIHDCMAKPISPDNEGLRLLSGYTRILAEADWLMTGPGHELAAQQVQDLLALALGAIGDGREVAGKRGLQSVRWELATAYIERNVADPHLSAANTARQLRISERSLQRLFESRGTSFSEHLLSRRLARAYAALGDVDEPATSIADLAIACGFNNISYFNRQFRGRYGATPSEVKHHAILRRGFDRRQ